MYSTVRPRHEIHVEVSARDVHKDVLEMTAKGEKNWREQLLPNSSLLAYLTFKVPFMYACVFTPFAGPPVPCDVHTARDRHSFSVWHKNRFSRVARAGWWLFTVLFWLCGSRSVVRCREKGVGVCLLCVACSTQWSICHPPECWGGGGGGGGKWYYCCCCCCFNGVNSLKRSSPAAPHRFCFLQQWLTSARL